MGMVRKFRTKEILCDILQKVELNDVQDLFTVPELLISDEVTV